MDFPKMLRRNEVQDATGLGRSSLYELMRRGDFPQPIKVSPGAVRWPADEIASWLASRPRATGERSQP